MTSGVYKMFAEAMAIIEGPAAAEKMLEAAIAAGKAERRSGFRQGEPVRHYTSRQTSVAGSGHRRGSQTPLPDPAGEGSW